MDSDTIAAIATASGRGGIGVIRLSGGLSLPICERLTGKTPKPRHATFCKVTGTNGELLDTGIALFFPGPASFTGEDVVELQVHGGPVILDLILAEVIAGGARMAQPGEFSRRAFLNDKIDLAQAEAIADLINSTTAKAALNASHSLQGDFSEAINELVAQVTHLRVYVEAAIDFPEEEIDFLQDGKVGQQLGALTAQFEAVYQAAEQGSIVREGMKLVIAGRPNAGKSSLLNALAGQDTAIVTDIAGTTRDVLREHIEIDGLPLFVVDTAGLRDSADDIEREGIRRAMAEVDSADHVLLVVDETRWTAALSVPAVLADLGFDSDFDTGVSVVLNKSDLVGQPAGPVDGQPDFIRLSARTGDGMDALRNHLKAVMGYQEGGESHFSARRRHLAALGRARDSLANGIAQLEQAGAGELLAEDLRQCQQYLGEITGAVSADELLGEIFSSFCIGK